MSKIAAVSEIFTDVWSVQDGYIAAYLPILASIIQNKPIDISELPQQVELKGQSILKSSPILNDWKTSIPHFIDAAGTIYNEWNDMPQTPGYKLVIPITGMIMKNSYYYSGTDLLREYIIAAQEIDLIDEIIFPIDSGGGFMKAALELVEEITACKIKTRAVVKGIAASAACWIAVSCDEVILTSDKSVMGSIGAMGVISDYTKYFEKLGIKMVELYATQSPDKNKPDRDFKATGDTSAYQAEIDSACQLMIDSIKSLRPAIAKTCFTGDVYTASQALATNLADSIKPLREVLSSKTNPNTNTMNIKNLIASMIGDGGDVKLTKEQFEQLANSTDKANTIIANTSALFGEKSAAEGFDVFNAVRGLQDENIRLTAEAAKKDETITALNTQVTELGKGLAGGTPPVTGAKAEGGAADSNDDLSPWEAKMQEKKDFLAQKRKMLQNED